MAKITTEVVRLTDTEIENIANYENWRVKQFKINSKQSHSIKAESRRADKLYRAALVGFAREGDKNPEYKQYQSYIKKANYDTKVLSEKAISNNGNMSVEEQKLAKKAVRQYANRASFEDLNWGYRHWFDGEDSFNTYYEQESKGKAGLFKSFDDRIREQVNRRAEKRGWWKFTKATEFYRNYLQG